MLNALIQPRDFPSMGKEKASAALFDQLQTAIEGGEGEEIVGKVKVIIAGTGSSAHNTHI